MVLFRAYMPVRAEVFDLFPRKNKIEGYCSSGSWKSWEIRFGLSRSTRHYSGSMPSKLSHWTYGHGGMFRSFAATRIEFNLMPNDI